MHVGYDDDDDDDDEVVVLLIVEVGKVVVLGLVVDTVVSLNLGVREKNLFVDKDLLGFASKFKAQLMN
ncbi:hypothetical protein SCA6_011875 [Theobroma cacao]